MYWTWDDTTLHTNPLCFKLSQKPSGLTFFPAFLRLPCAEIIGWHALMALFMTCFIKTVSCIELGVCKGEFCFFALLGTGLRRCLISGRSQPGRLAVFPCFWKKKCYLHWEKVIFFCTFVGNLTLTSWFHFSTHLLPCKSKFKNNDILLWFHKSSRCSENLRQLQTSHLWCSPGVPDSVLMRQIRICDWKITHWHSIYLKSSNEGYQLKVLGRLTSDCRMYSDQLQMLNYISLTFESDDKGFGMNHKPILSIDSKALKSWSHFAGWVYSELSSLNMFFIRMSLLNPSENIALRDLVFVSSR